MFLSHLDVVVICFPVTREMHELANVLDVRCFSAAKLKRQALLTLKPMAELVPEQRSQCSESVEQMERLREKKPIVSNDLRQQMINIAFS